MSLNMYIGEVKTQTQSMNAFCIATIQGMEQAINSIDAFASDVVLQGKTYDSAKLFLMQTYRPLAQGIIYLCEELIRQNDKFPADFQAEVATVDVIEHEILDQIREINRTIASMEAISENMPGMPTMIQVYDAMKRELQKKLERLYKFNETSSDNYSTALELAASIAQGLAEVQSGKGFNATSGTFSTQGLNMDWAASIQKIVEERNHQANKIEDGNTEESDVLQDSSSEKSMLEKIVKGVWDGSGQAVGAIIEGFKSLDDTATKENIKYAIGHPIETVSTMWNTFSDSFINDVLHGDAESITKWGTNIFVQLGLGWMGDKGLSKTATLATKGTTVSKGVTKASEAVQSLTISNQFAFAGGNGIRFGFNNKIPQTELNQAYYNFAKTKISSSEKRNSPGTVTSSFNLEQSLGTQKKLMYNGGSIGVIPQEIRDKLVGKEFKSFDEFRAEFWRTVADSSYVEEFGQMNIKLMSKGKAPYAPIKEHYGKNNKYVLHHKQPIDKGGDVYNLDNLIIVSPKMHQNILDPSYHFGNKGL